MPRLKKFDPAVAKQAAADRRNPLLQALTTTQAAKLLQITPERIAQLVKAGFIEKLGRGKWEIGALVQGYITFLKDENRRGQKNQAQNRVAEQRAKQLGLKNAREEGLVIALDEAGALFEEVTGTYVSALNGLPAQITRDVAERKRIEKIIDAQRADLERRFKKRASSILADRGATSTGG